MAKRTYNVRLKRVFAYSVSVETDEKTDAKAEAIAEDRAIELVEDLGESPINRPEAEVTDIEEIGSPEDEE